MLEVSDANILQSALVQESVLRTRFEMLAERDGFAVAVSGGPDSLALLVMIARWRDVSGYAGKILILSVDHGLRAQSADEVRLVARIAARYGFMFEGLVWTGAKPTHGLAAAARAARYNLMADQMLAHGFSSLLLAHHRDDQAETVLMRMAHGTGLGGLRGMSGVSRFGEIELVRPLLDVSKDALVSLVIEAGLEAVADPSNFDARYERVRWRGMLAALKDIGLDSARLALLAKRAGRADEALNFAMRGFLRTHVRVEDSGIGQVSLSEFLAQPREIGQRVLITVAENLGGPRGKNGYAALELGQAESLYVRLRQESENGGVTCAGVRFAWRRGVLKFGRETGRNLAPTVSLTAGDAVFWDDRFDVRIAAQAQGGFEIGALGRVNRATLEAQAGRTLPEMVLVQGVACARRNEKIVAIAGFMAHKDIAFSLRSRDVFAR